MKSHQSIEAGRSRWWQAESGFTLVELMAAVVITSVIVAAGFTALTGTSKAARANDQAASTQQNVRLAMEMISADIKMAGFGMTGPVGACNTAIVPADNNPAGPLTAINDTGPDSVSLVVPITGPGAPLGTLQVQATGPITTIQLSPGSVAAMQAAGLAVNSVVSIGGVVSGTVSAINVAGDALTLLNAIPAPAVFPGCAAPCTGTQVYLLQCITYQIIPAPDAFNICAGNTPCLVRGVAPALNCNIAASPCVPITDGIEDLQLAYACDGCNAAVNGGIADGIIDSQTPPFTAPFAQTDFVSNNAWTVAPMTPTTIRLVQINVVARQTQNDLGFGEPQTPAVSSAAALVVSDHNAANNPGFNLPTYQQIRRRVLTRTVEARNLGL